MPLAHPTAIVGVVLNDIGPVIERNDIARIKKLPQQRNFAEARRSCASWATHSSRSSVTSNGSPRFGAPGRSTMVSWCRLRRAIGPRVFSEVHVEQPLPPMWNEFDALAGVRLLVFCGANSDILFGRDGNGHAGASSRNAGYRSGEPGPRLFDVEDLLRRVVDFVARGSACFTRISPRSRAGRTFGYRKRKAPKRKTPAG
jgi:hypothetical protein